MAQITARSLDMCFILLLHQIKAKQLDHLNNNTDIPSDVLTLSFHLTTNQRYIKLSHAYADISNKLNRLWNIHKLNTSKKVKLILKTK